MLCHPHWVSSSPTASRPGPAEAAILARFGLTSAALIGSGGEARVFAMDASRVLRIFGGRTNLDVIELVNSLCDTEMGVLTPQVLDQGHLDGQDFTIDVRIPGTSLSAWLASSPPEDDRRRVLLDHLDVAGRLRLLPNPDQGFRCLFGDPAPSLVELLQAQANVGLNHSQGLLHAALPDLDQRIVQLFAELEQRTVEPRFVHADYFPGNVMTDGERITGVIDISVHALAADPVMDEVGAVAFLAHAPYPERADDERWLEAVLRDRLGDDVWLISAYRRWYGLYYSMDHGLIDWAAEQFTR